MTDLDADDEGGDVEAERPAEDIPAALLTESQRAYVWGDKDYSASTERQVLARIRDRVEATMYDLSLLAAHYPDEEMDKLFNPRTREEGDSVPSWPLAAFLYANRTGGILPPGVSEDPPSSITLRYRAESMERTIERGILKGLAARDGIATRRLDVEIDIEPTESLHLLHENELAELDRDVLDDLFATKEIDHEAYAKALGKKLGRGEE